MILDFFSLNILNIYLASILLIIFRLNDQRLMILLIFDILINVFPIITILILLLYFLKESIFKIFKISFYSKYILITIFYYLFGIVLYSIYNDFNMGILIYLTNYLLINMIIYYLVIKYYEHN